MRNIRSTRRTGPPSGESSAARAGGGLGGDHLGAADNFQAFPAGAVHEEERDAVVGGDVARREELAVAGEIGEAEGVRAEELQETARPAPVLTVGPAVGVDRGPINAVAA